MAAVATTTTTTTVYVVVFAHPDDESMFFLPTIRSLVDAGETIWWLCLTTGDHDGLGRIREKELGRAGRFLGASEVLIRNDDDDSGDSGMMRDHPTKRYDRKIVAAAIRDSLSSRAAADDDDHHLRLRREYVLITFDENGVSGHVNHTDVYLGVMRLMQEQRERRKQEGRRRRQQQQRPTTTTTTTSAAAIGGGDDDDDDDDGHQNPPLVLLEAWYLVTERNPIVKYLPIVSWILVVVSWMVPGIGFESMAATTSSSGDDGSKKRYTRTYRMHDPGRNWSAMAIHASQFVWYRRLFVVFSCYAYRNHLLCVRAAADPPPPSSSNGDASSSSS